MIPAVWTIAGTDPAGLVGMQADLETFRQFGVEAGSIVTAVTAQNSHILYATEAISSEQVSAQCTTLIQTLKPQAIKVGLLATAKTIECIGQFLKDYNGFVVLDPVMSASAGKSLLATDPQDYRARLIELFPALSLLTPNRMEAEIFLNRPIHGYDDIPEAAEALLALGAQSVLLKGGHIDETGFSQDYWSDGKHSFWLASPRLDQKNYRGTGCVLSAAITACLALGYALPDALVIAKMYLHRGIKLATNLGQHSAKLFHGPWPEDEASLPLVANTPIQQTVVSFPRCPSIGLYPVVDSSRWIEQLLAQGVRCIQLRIKDQNAAFLESEIQKSIVLAKQYQATLFINDHWQLALKLGAPGVHLGQEDLETADLEILKKAGMYLGLSTHSYYELARAYTLKPSYLACGPIYATQSKEMASLPQGIPALVRYRRTLPNYPLVAIGGITSERLPAVLATKVDGIALISAITQANDPLATTRHFLTTMKEASS